MHKPAADADFATTHWTLVLAAGQQSSVEAQVALGKLCQAYWYPLYAYVRRHVAHVDEAQDLTQEFFARLLEKNTIAIATPTRGRFRAFLLTALKNFLANERDRANAIKRGGRCAKLSLDWEHGESRFTAEHSHRDTAERIFDRDWTLALLERVLNQLREEADEAGKLRRFELLQVGLTGDPPAGTYANIAAELGSSEDAIKVAAHRLRQRYRERLRAEVAHTVDDPDEIDGELRNLLSSLGT